MTDNRKISVRTLALWSGIIFAAFCWGTGCVATRLAFEEGLGPLTVAALATAIASVIALLTLFFRHFTSNVKPKENSLQFFSFASVMALTHFTGPFILFTLALQYASAGFVSLIVALTPVSTALWAHFLIRNETIKKWQLVGLALAFFGVTCLLTVRTGGIGQSGQPVISLIYAGSGTIMFGFGSTYSRYRAGSYGPNRLALIQVIISSLVLVPLMLIFEGLPKIYNLKLWYIISYIAVFDNIAAFAIFYIVVRYVPVSTAAVSGYFVPLFALILGQIVLDEIVTKSLVIGGCFILGGVVVVERTNQQQINPIPEHTYKS